MRGPVVVGRDGGRVTVITEVCSVQGTLVAGVSAAARVTGVDGFWSC